MLSTGRWDPSSKVFLKAQCEPSELLLSRQYAAVITADACTRLAAAHAMRRPLHLAPTHIMLAMLLLLLHSMESCCHTMP